MVTGYACLSIRLSCYAFHGLDPLSCSDSALASVTVNPFGHIGGSLWAGARPAQRGEGRRGAGVHPCLQRDLNLQPQCSSFSNINALVRHRDNCTSAMTFTFHTFRLR
jgi:hypothetical protein